MRTGPALILAALVAGCSKSGSATVGDSGTTGTSSGTPVAGTTSAPSELDLSCAAQGDNALRFDCTLTSNVATSVDLEWAPTAGGTTRSMSVEASAGDTPVTLWGFKPELEYEVVATSGLGDEIVVPLATGSLPTALQGTIATTTGTLSIDQVLVELPCGGAPTVAMLDTDGEIVWYQQYDEPNWSGGGIAYQGFDYTPRGTILLSLAMNEWYEHTVGGDLVRHMTAGVDWPGDPIHHDIHMGPDGRVYALFGYVQAPYAVEYIFDGFYIWDDTGLVAEWRMTDHYPVADGWDTGLAVFWAHIWPTTSDYAHSNSIAAHPDGSVLLSLKGQETMMEVDGDPDSPSFGQIQWAVAGNPPGSFYDGDLTITSTGGVTSGLDFYQNHHASYFADGRVGLFDNRSSVTTSRGLVFEIDEVAGTADILEVYETNLDCPAQGAIYDVSNGNRLVTCGPQQTVMEFAPGSATPHWEMDVSCGGNSVMVPRAIPVE